MEQIGLFFSGSLSGLSATANLLYRRRDESDSTQSAYSGKFISLLIAMC